MTVLMASRNANDILGVSNRCGSFDVDKDALLKEQLCCFKKDEVADFWRLRFGVAAVARFEWFVARNLELSEKDDAWFALD